ncbi:hypothetical protein [Gracilibacillus xinjiangensis]|uniref:Uncharacterized protein n=1 Tax=Gracilibacillus xinjiangensis TaxID=1193282 RepID=A0ABV8WV48_9BACI
MAIQPLVLQEVANHIIGLIDHAIVTIDDVQIDHEIYRNSIEDNVLKTFVYVDNEEGTITDVRLVDTLGRPLNLQEMHIEKGPDGLIFVFKITLLIQTEIEGG